MPFFRRWVMASLLLLISEILKLSILSKALHVNRLFLAAILLSTASFTTYARATTSEDACAKQVSEIATAVYMASDAMKWPVSAAAKLTDTSKDKNDREYQTYTVNLQLTNGLRMLLLPYQITVTSENCELAEIKTMSAPQK
jgi:hypothetical protein